MKVLFVCGKARMRSPTAADIVADWKGISSDFAGLSNDADEKVSTEQIAWADMIIVMQARQKKRLTGLFGSLLAGKKLVVLNVEDKFEYMAPELVALLTPRLRMLLNHAA